MKVAPLPTLRRVKASPWRGVPAWEDYHRRLATAHWVVRAEDFGVVVFEGGDDAFPGLAGCCGASWLDCVTPADRGRVRNFLKSADVAPLDYRLAIPDGGECWIRHWLLPAETRAGHLHGIVQAIGEQKQLEGECLQAGERERTRIGQELHDDICQVLAGLTYLMGVIHRRGKDRGEPLPAEFPELHESLVAAMNRTRAMAHGLFPAHLADGTLRDALEELARQLQTRFGFALTVKIPTRLPAHDGEVLTHLFRIAQEAMTNGVRHGGATAGEAVVRVLAGDIEIVLRDNGGGFSRAQPVAGVGLRSMRHRAQRLGGTIEFGNHPEGGAFVRLLYPLPAVSRRTQQAA